MISYDRDFYRRLDTTAEVSARRVAPLVLQLVSVRSIVDVGCGDGGWLAVFRSLGVPEILGLDGPWIDDAQLKISPLHFRRARLDEPFGLNRCFDLAMSVEVAEHLPPERASSFVGELTQLAPVVLFSAAVPGQGGVHHLNEQWPAYWTRLFAARGYRAIDVLRPKLWNDGGVAYWYKQNLLLFAAEEGLSAHPILAAAAASSPAEPMDLVHPDLFHLAGRLAQPRLGRWLKMAPDAIRRSLRAPSRRN